MGWFRERWAAISEEVGDKRHSLLDIAKVFVAGAAMLCLWLYGRSMTALEIVAVSAAVVFALLAWIMTEGVVRLRGRLTPRLNVSYDDKTLDCHKTVQYGEAPNHHFGRSLRFRVTCATDVNVEQCSGFLTRIEYRAHGGQFSDEALFEPTYLNWALSNPPFSPVTVYPRVSRYLGFCRTDERKNGFYSNIAHRSYVTPEVFDKVGEYRFHIEIVGARVPTISRVLQVIWNGKWNEIRACLVENVRALRKRANPATSSASAKSIP